MPSFEESLDELPQGIRILGLRAEKTLDPDEWATLSRHLDGKPYVTFLGKVSPLNMYLESQNDVEVAVNVGGDRVWFGIDGAWSTYLAMVNK
jgi:hypothetical protein